MFTHVACPRQKALNEALARAKKGLAITFALSGFFNILQLALPVYSMQVFDRVLTSGSLSTLTLLTLMLVLATACSLILDWVRALLLGAAASGVDLALSRRALTGTDHHSREALNDIDILRNFVGSSLTAAMLDAPWALAFILAMFILHLMLGLTTVVVILLVLSFAWYGHAASRASYNALAAPSQQISELLAELQPTGETDGLPGHRSVLLERLLDLRTHSTAAIQAFNAQRGWLDAAARGIRTLAQVTILAATASLVVMHDIQTGAIIASSLLFARAIGPFERIAASMQTIVAVRAAWHRTVQRCNHEFSKPKLPLPRILGEITFSDVTYIVPGRHSPLLYRLNLKASPGTLTTIFGSEGAGKTTFARLVVGALIPAAGEIRMDGSKISDFSPQELGRQIGYLAQTAHLGTGTISQIIAGTETPDPEAVVAAAKLTGAHDRVQLFPDGYQTRLGDAAFQPSAGERQRIALARAVYNLPQIVVLDEPTNGLDDTGESTLVNIISALKQVGSTLVVISRLPVLMQLSDQMFMFDGGKAQSMNLERFRSRGPRIVASSE